MRSQKRQEIADEVWNHNYRAPGENTLHDTWVRQAKFIENEEIRDDVYKDFLWLLEDFKGIAGGRITANLGVDGREGTTLMNCYVHNPRDIKYKDPDSISGIYDMLKAQALTLKSEGGYGMNFSWIRPAGMYVSGIGARTPGVIQFMSLWNQSSAVITMGSDKILGEVREEEKKKIRKGAQMGVLEIWHPEIEDFIDAKLVEGCLNKFNISVGITEGFIDAVKNEQDWDLIFPDTEHDNYESDWDGNIKDWKNKGFPVTVYKTVKARDLWEKIMKATYTRNDPGVLFLDLANKLNTVPDIEDIVTTNPCITGDTIVAVADGKGDRTIKELADIGKDVPVYCDDNNGNVVIRTMRHPRITGTKPVFKITLENGHTIKQTANHKYKTTTGEYKQVCDLKVGDGLKIMTKFDASIKDIFPKSNNKSQDYIWITYNTKIPYCEHRLIYNYNTNSVVPKGSVIHHKDFNAKNNHIDNLQLMTKEEHDRYHGDMMRGENNPMNKWYKNASDEEKQIYHDNMSKAVSADKNGNFSGFTHEEIYEHAIILTKKYNRIFSSNSWKQYASENNLPQNFTKWRKEHLGTIPEMAVRAAKEVGVLPDVMATGKVYGFYFDALEQGYNAEIIDGTVYVRKNCEHCGKEFLTSYLKRERGFCSSECGTKSYHNKRQVTIKEQQIEVYNRKKFELDCDPIRKEWVDECTEKNISCEIGRSGSPFKSFEELKEASVNFNHRIVSIEPAGEEVVYNGTVDEFHNFFVGGFKEISPYNKPNSLYINNLQCGEVLMPTGVCLLSSLNLTRYVIRDEHGNSFFDYANFKKAVKIAVRFADNINDISNVPLDEYKDAMLKKRRLGIGVLGLGSLHYMLGIRYGSETSLELIRDIFKCKAETEILASAELGKEKGSFPLFDKDKFFNTYWWKNLDISESVKKQVEEIGCMRNSHRSANAPTGNMSIYAGVVSGGIEPVFMREYTRWSIVPEKDRAKLKAEGLVIPEATHGEWFETDVFKKSKKGTDEILKGSYNGVDYEIDRNRGLTKASQVVDYGWQYVKDNFSEEEIAEMERNNVFATTMDLSVDDHVNTLAIVAKYTELSSSKTINIPNDYPYEDFKDIYFKSWEMGIKGITTYRDGTMTAVLEKKQEVAEQKEELQNIFQDAKDDVIINNVTLPNEYYSKGIVIRDNNKKKWYVNIAFADAGLTKPFAIFVNTNCKETHEVAEETINAMMRLASEVGIGQHLIDDQITKYSNQSNVTKIARSIGFLLRHNVAIIDIVNVLDEGNYPLSSFTFHIKRLLKQYIKDGTEVQGKHNKCPKCGGTMIFNEGCILCKDCSWSKCQ